MWVESCLLPWVFCFSAQVHVPKTNAKNVQKSSVQPQKNMRPYVVVMEKPTITHRMLHVKTSVIIPGEHVNSACALLTIKNYECQTWLCAYRLDETYDWIRVGTNLKLGISFGQLIILNF